MSKTIHLDPFDPASVSACIREIEAYKKWVIEKTHELAERLANMGVVLASIEYSRVPYHGIKDVDLSVDQRGESTYAIVASGETVLILEFGAGVTYGYGHPQAGEFGMGPTTYPGQKHAADPNGWWLPKEAGGGHTYGNPPAMSMYLTGKELRNRLEEVAREVFST